MPRSVAFFLLSACAPSYLPPDVPAAPLGRAVIVHPDTVLLDDVPGVETVEVAPRGLLVGTDGTALALRPGNVVVGRLGGGYLRRVVDVRTTAAGAWLETVPASLADALLEASISEHVTLDARRSGERWDLGGAVLLDETVGTAPNQVRAAVTLGEGAYVEVEPTFDFSLDVFSSESTFTVDTAVRMDAVVPVVATLDGSVRVAEEVPLASRSVPFEFWIGPVPVVGVATVDLLGRVELDADGAVTQTLDAEAHASGRFAAGYADDWWSEADVDLDVSCVPSAPDTSASFRAKAAVVARVSTTLYGTATPTVDVVPWVEASSCPGGVTVDAGVEGTYGCTADVFGWELASFGPEPYAVGPWALVDECD